MQKYVFTDGPHSIHQFLDVENGTSEQKNDVRLALDRNLQMLFVLNCGNCLAINQINNRVHSVNLHYTGIHPHYSMADYRLTISLMLFKI
ncbi:Uncharacterised protein [Mycobacterium tuberculosis]|nr:Uncharacterised protein [Mycobacterium tuberculosis]